MSDKTEWELFLEKMDRVSEALLDCGLAMAKGARPKPADDDISGDDTSKSTAFAAVQAEVNRLRDEIEDIKRDRDMVIDNYNELMREHNMLQARFSQHIRFCTCRSCRHEEELKRLREIQRNAH